MKLTAQDLEGRARWLVSMRWLACLGVFAVVWIAASPLRVLPDPRPLYAVTCAIVFYNLVLEILGRVARGRVWLRQRARSIILLQIILDLLVLTLLLYFADIVRNPFILYFAFHIILASILLPGWIPYSLAFLASAMIGAVLTLQFFAVIPRYPLNLPLDVGLSAAVFDADNPLYLVGVMIAIASTLGITVFLTTSVSRYVEGIQAQIRQHAKMLGIGQLVAGFAHQISNPLDGLQNGLRQIEQGVRGNKHLEETAHLMVAALGRIENVARRLQEFARPQGLEVQACDVNKAVDATLQLFGKGLGERGVTVEQDPGPVPLAWGDPYSIEEIVFNLCTNALDAMPKGGRLLIKTHTMQRPDVSPDGCVAIEVRDTGVGIPGDKLEKIFEPFYTTKAQSGGTGLGLGLCRMLLSEMGGIMEVESLLSKGSTFRILLAVAPGGGEDPTKEERTE
jgi:signal transduction histidine kinase